MIANSNMPELRHERLDQMIALALTHQQDRRPASERTGPSWHVADWFRNPVRVPVPVRAFAVIAVLIVTGLQALPSSPTRTADIDIYSDVSDYMMFDLLDHLS